jgi:hypothetical protein
MFNFMFLLLYCREKSPYAYCTGRLCGPQCCLDVMGKRNISYFCQESNLMYQQSSPKKPHQKTSRPPGAAEDNIKMGLRQDGVV